MSNTSRSFRIGQKFMLSDVALENYGEHYRGVVFTVKQWFDHYCPVSEMENDIHGHPGYDGDGPWDCLYETTDNPPFQGALYDYEMVPIRD